MRSFSSVSWSCIFYFEDFCGVKYCLPIVQILSVVFKGVTLISFYMFFILFFIAVFEDEFNRCKRSGQLGICPSTHRSGHVSSLHDKLFLYFETTSSQIEFGCEDVGATKVGSARCVG